MSLDCFGRTLGSAALAKFLCNFFSTSFSPGILFEASPRAFFRLAKMSLIFSIEARFDFSSASSIDVLNELSPRRPICGPNAIDTLAIERPRREASFSYPLSSLGRYGEALLRNIEGIEGIERKDSARGRFWSMLVSSSDAERLRPVIGDELSGSMTATPTMSTVHVTDPCALPMARVQ